MNQNETMIDKVLVHLFNNLLRIEEKTLQKQVGDLSTEQRLFSYALTATGAWDRGRPRPSWPGPP